MAPMAAVSGLGKMGGGHYLVALPVLLLGDLLGGELRLLGRLRRHEDLERIIVGLQPRPHLLLERARKETDLLSERDDGAGDGYPVIPRTLFECLVERAGRREKRLSRAG